MARLITVNLREVTNGARYLRRATEADEDESNWRTHARRAVGTARAAGEHDLADHFQRPLDQDEEADLEEEDEDLEDQSQHGRGDPEKRTGRYNTAGGDLGKASMESLYRQLGTARGSALRESIQREIDRRRNRRCWPGGKQWSANLLE
jgi:hypothetical protein